MAGEEPQAEAGAAEAGTASIVRYPNRRLYDRSQGRYVTLPEIAAMVRAGKAVSVRDSKTNDDLTSTILTQIILEHHPERMDLLPVPMLHLMIRTNGAVLGLLREYFRQSQAYVDFWQSAAAFNPMAASMGWVKSLLPGAPPSGASPPPPPEAGRADADALARRLAEMERKLDALTSAAGNGDGSAAGPKPGTAEPEPRRSGRNRGRSRARK